MSGAQVPPSGRISWGRVAAVAGVIVVLRGLLRGASRALSVVAAEVEYRIGDTWTRFTPSGRR